MKISLRQRDLHEKHRKKFPDPAAAVSAAVVTAALAFFFYRSPWAFPVLSPVGFFCYRKILKDKEQRRREEMAVQFRECILSVSTLLQAGYSAENAFMECEKDMRLMYDENASICRELKIIRRGLSINITLEELLQDMALRSGCEDISRFAQIFSLAKRNGGNMAAIIRSSAALIGKRIELRRELCTLLSGKKMELNVMKVMPFAILVYIGMSNPGYFDTLYGNFTGIAIMTGCLAVYMAACALGDRVMAGMLAEA